MQVRLSDPALSPTFVSTSSGARDELEAPTAGQAALERKTSTAKTSAERTRGRGPLLGIIGRQLVRLDRASLDPVRGCQVDVRSHRSGWSFSPDGSELVLGSENSRRGKVVGRRHALAAF